MNNTLAALRSTLRQIATFVAFVARGFPLFFVVLTLTVLVLVFEYVATSLMIPLSSGAFASQGLVTRAWQGLVQMVGLPPTQRTWLWLFFLAMIRRIGMLPFFIYRLGLGVLLLWLAFAAPANP